MQAVLHLCSRPGNWLSFFQTTQQPNVIISNETRVEKAASDFSKIRCPNCSWQPNPLIRWACNDCPKPENFFNGCGMLWNTFVTRGLCPGCGHQWQYTSCPRCHQWSLHEDWYTDTHESD